jgi:hypothetical protein
MTRLGILDHLEYVSREYEEYGRERCDVIVFVGPTKEFPNTIPLVVSITGFRFEDTYQVAARKALRYLCQIYEEHIDLTPMRFFPPLERNNPIWVTRMRTLVGVGLREDNPTTLFMSKYFLSLYEQYDRQTTNLRECMCRAEEAEKQIRSLEVQFAEAKAQAAIAESREAIPL